MCKNERCNRCWTRRAQIGVWCQRCFDEMYEIAKAGDGDPHTCQGPHCDQLTVPGKPLCADCEAFYRGVLSGA